MCLGNICRSPTAEAVARAEFAQAGLDVAVASCGTGSWHVGQGADPRAVRAGARAGYDLSAHRGRQLQPDDFSRYRWLLAMDRSNHANMLAMCPAPYRDRVGLFMEMAAAAPPVEVPDPYEGGVDDFAHVIALVQRGARGLIDRLR